MVDELGLVRFVLQRKRGWLFCAVLCCAVLAWGWGKREEKSGSGFSRQFNGDNKTIMLGTKNEQRRCLLFDTRNNG